MRPKTFYPDITLKIKEVDYKNARLECINDKGEEVILNILNKNKKPTKKEFLNFLQKEAKNHINDNFINAIADKISETSIADSIEQEILQQNPDIIKHPRLLARKLSKKLEEKSKEIIEDMYFLRKDTVIKVKGITNENGKYITSKIDFQSPNENEFQILSIPNSKNILYTKIPIKLIPTKTNRYRAVTNSSFISFKETKEVLRMYLRTLRAYELGKIKTKPNIVFSINSKNENIISLINEINKKIINTSFKEQSLKIKEFLEKIEKTEYKNKLEVFLPLFVEINKENEIKEIKNSMINVSFANAVKYRKISINELENIFQDFFSQKNPVFNCFYKLKTENERYGFFKNSIFYDKKTVHSSTYEQILYKTQDYILNKKTKNIEKNKNFKNVE